MLSIALLYLPSPRPEVSRFSRETHQAFDTIVNFAPRFVAGSLLAYYISQTFDVWAFHRIRQWAGERWLWLKNSASTLTSQALDTVIYARVAWWGTVDLVTALKLGAAKYFFKAVIACIDTLFIYWARAMHNRKASMRTADA